MMYIAQPIPIALRQVSYAAGDTGMYGILGNQLLQ